MLALRKSLVAALLLVHCTKASIEVNVGAVMTHKRDCVGGSITTTFEYVAHKHDFLQAKHYLDKLRTEEDTQAAARARRLVTPLERLVTLIAPL